MTVHPKTMRQQIRKSYERLPLSGRLGQSMIKSSVYHQILRIECETAHGFPIALLCSKVVRNATFPLKW
jgi:hypothetical protein